MEREAMRLLIVEDNAQMRRLIKSVVGDIAETVCECCDGADALDAYTTHLPDWVLMDIRMERMDGLTASRQIKAAYPQANICIVTDYGDAKTREAARQAGARSFVSKDNLFDLRVTLQEQN
jgi:CheY-like chemotaxis protein